MNKLRSLIVLVLSVCSMGVGSQPILSGEKTVFLRDAIGKEIAIAKLRVGTPVEGAYPYSLVVHYDRFDDFFLSMKEVKCLTGPELWCHLRYPYPQPRTIKADDLSWLSHDLLFMYKKPRDFGARFRNGIYYHLVLEGESIRGVAQAVDLNHLAAPPSDLSIPPYGDSEREAADESSRWLPYLEIR